LITLIIAQDLKMPSPSQLSSFLKQKPPDSHHQNHQHPEQKQILFADCFEKISAGLLFFVFLLVFVNITFGFFRSFIIWIAD